MSCHTPFVAYETMDEKFDATKDGTVTGDDLPTPGAVQEWGDRWIPTLDGEPIRDIGWSGFESREEAWAEAIRWVKHRAGLAMQVRLGAGAGCVIEGDRIAVVETVAEARRAILRHAIATLGGKGQDSGDRQYLRLGGGRTGPTWNDLARCETNRRYDPDDPDAGMTCRYLLYEQGDLDGVGGVIWTFAVSIWAAAPPEVWDHPADKPCGLDTDGR